MSDPYRTAVKIRLVEFVRLWTSDDDDDDTDVNSTSSSVTSATSSKKPKLSNSTDKKAEASAEDKTAKRMSDFDQHTSKEIRLTMKKQRTETAKDKQSSGASSIDTEETRNNCDDYLSDNQNVLQEEKMRKGEYKRRCASRRVHSSRKMIYSRIMTLRLRALPKHSPLIARKLRF